MAAHSGWLHKKGAMGAFGERRRFFELDDVEEELNYFKTDDSGCSMTPCGACTPRTPRTPHTPFRTISSPTTPVQLRSQSSFFKKRQRQGVIKLADVKAIDDSQIALGCFDLITRHRVYELRADTAQEGREWVVALRPFISTLNSTSSTSSVGDTPSAEAVAHTLAEPLIGGSSSPPKDSMSGPGVKSAYQPTVPWCVETVWVDEAQSDAPLDITADLGAMPAGGFRNLNVMLSDGTKLALSAKDFDLMDGGVHEVADAGASVLLAQLVKQAVDAPPPPRETTVLHFGAACCASAAAGLGLARMPFLVDSLTRSSALVLLLLAAAAACATASAMLARAHEQYQDVDVLDAEGGNGDTFKLRLRAARKSAAFEEEGGEKGVTATRSAAERSGRLSHPERLPSSAVSKVLSESLYEANDEAAAPKTLLVSIREQSSKSLPPELTLMKSRSVIFSGKWKLNLSRSDDPSEMLKAMGVPLVARAAIARCSRTVMIEQDGLEWTETMVTPVVTKTVTMTLDSTPYTEMSPVDKTSCMMRSQYEDDGRVVVTRSTCSDGIRSQVVTRHLIEDGKVYHTVNTLTVKGGKVITTNNYFDRIA